MRGNRKAGVSRYADHPIVQYVRSLPEELYLTREVAEQVGCSQTMLVYLRRHSTEQPLGATHQAAYGSVKLHLYTPQRIADIAAYLDSHVTKVGRGHRRKGPVPMWTRTEQVQRRRALDRARSYRRRAVLYRSNGQDKEAARMDRLEAALSSQLAQASALRWEKVHGTKKRARRKSSL